MSKAYARRTSRKTQQDNYMAHQQRVRRAKSKHQRELADFGKRQQEKAEMAMEDKDAELKDSNASLKIENEFKRHVRGESDRPNRKNG